MFIKNNLFFLVIAFLIVFIAPAYALKNYWKNGKVYAEGTYVFGGYNDQYNVYLTIIENDWDEKVVSLVMPKDECVEAEEKVTPTSVLIDGSNVPMLERCIEKDVVTISPKTEAAIEYITHELKKRKAIKYKLILDEKKVKFVFSSKGFLEAYSTYKPKLDGF